MHPTLNIESTEKGKRLVEARMGKAAWRLWGPYLSERQWGTVREDYSAHGDAWEYFPIIMHALARIDGEKMVWLEFAITNNDYASP